MSSTFDYGESDILQTEIIEDGVTVTKTSRGSQLGGALLGGILAGGVGAVMGGLSGKTIAENKINNIELKIVVNDTETPVYYIVFLNDTDFVVEDLGIDEMNENYPYLNSKKKADQWHGLISVLIKRADQEDREKENTGENEITRENPISSESVADELLKLSGLLKQGIITQEEFDNQKKRLLA